MLSGASTAVNGMLKCCKTGVNLTFVARSGHSRTQRYTSPIIGPVNGQEACRSTAVAAKLTYSFAIGVALILAYTLSVGPVYRLLQQDHIDYKTFSAVYAPILAIEKRSVQFKNALIWYLNLWHGPISDKYMTK